MKDSYTVKIQWDDETKVLWGHSEDKLDEIDKCDKINFILSRQEKVIYD